jgi:hypothetical protein
MNPTSKELTAPKEAPQALALAAALAAAVPVTCTCGEPLHREFHSFGLWVHPDGTHTKPQRVSFFRSILHDATPQQCPTE